MLHKPVLNQEILINPEHSHSCDYMGLDARKPVFDWLRTTKAQTSLRIRAVWSAHLLFAYWEVTYLSMLQAKFQFSS